MVGGVGDCCCCCCCCDILATVYGDSGGDGDGDDDDDDDDDVDSLDEKQASSAELIFTGY